MKVLAVDDEFDFCELVKASLEQVGFIVETAEDGTDGLNKFYAAKPELVILDYNMPEVTGVQMAKKINETDPDIPLILLTGMEEIREEFNPKIFINIFQKPVGDCKKNCVTA